VGRVLIVGAGVAGLLAARQLESHGHEVVVVDKGYRPGGRLATRRVADATFDTGAQFLTVRDPRVRAHLEDWLAAGVARRWFEGSPDVPAGDPDARSTGEADPARDGHPRYRGAPTMRSIAEHLAASLTVHLASRVTRTTVTNGRWQLQLIDRSEQPLAPLAGDALLLTPPVPQTRELVAGIPLDQATTTLLDAVRFAPCIAVLAVPTGPPRLPERGAVRLASEPIAWLTDNHVTGASATPAVTVHGTAAFSRARWSDSDAEVAGALLRAARHHLGVATRPVHVHRWRYAAPITPDLGSLGVDPDAPAMVDLRPGPPVVVAGDGLTTGRVEGAARSGLAAADRLADLLA
jgi:renalase